MDTLRDIHGLRVLVCDSDGPALAQAGDANTFVSLGWEHKADMVAIPLARIDASFFRLSTRWAGEVVQKFVNYNMRLTIVGDISALTAQSQALHDFVYEANRGRMTWFVADIPELEQRLNP